MNLNNSIIENLGINAKKAASKLANIHNDKKNKALEYLKKDLKLLSSKLIKINKIDIENAHSMKLSQAMIDRLTLNDDRIETMISSLDEIIKLKDTLTNSINTMSTSFNALSKDVTRDMTHALTKVDEKVGFFNQQVDAINKSQVNFS